MTKNVRVFDDSSKAVGSTYKKRASQLVKKTRAVWLDGDSIMLKGGTGMDIDAIPISNGFPARAKRKGRDSALGKILDEERKFVATRFSGADADWLDEEIEAYAKAKMIAKRRLILHISLYLSVNTAITFFFNGIYFWNIFILQLIVLTWGAWGVALVMHIVLYATRPTPFKLQKEMLKLKRKL